MRLGRNRFWRWWFTGLAIINVVTAPPEVDLALRWFDVACAVIFAFIAGWYWREWATQRRVGRWLREAAATLAAESGEFRKGEWR